jgi:hypothetical protein
MKRNNKNINNQKKSNKQIRRKEGMLRVPVPAMNDYIKRPFLNGIVTTKNVGTLTNPLTNFVCAEAQVNNLASFTMTGGTGTISNSTSGLLDFTPYALGRVNHVHVSAEFSNLEPALPIAGAIFYSDTQPSTIISTRLLALLANTNFIASRAFYLGAINGESNSGKVNLSTDMLRIVQDTEVLNDRDFISVLNPTPAAPNQVVWLGVVIYTITGANFTVGATMDLTSTVRVKAFSRLPDS